VVYVFPRADAEPARLGITVPKRVGDAVDRNRIKRQVREAFAGLGPDTARGSDVAVVIRAGLAEAVEANGFAWLASELAGLIEAVPE
jgi:ribonuclease P protein component